MFADFDFDVIIRSLPYLFYDGMTFTLMLTALATIGGIFFGTILKGASRISARIVPKMMPPVIDNSVSVTVKVIHSLNR